MNSYDQFYDEHVHLFSLSMLYQNLLEKSKLRVFDVDLLPYAWWIDQILCM